VSATVDQFLSVLQTMGTPVTYHRETGGTVCPCVSPEGYRSPSWHLLNDTAPVCNEAGKLTPTIVNLSVLASIQPIRGTRFVERVTEMVGEIQRDDQLGFFPVIWQSQRLEFRDWDDSGAQYIVYDGQRYLAINADKLPDIDGDPDHHWEVALRLIKTERP
jgi:hypothetical protein